MEGGDLRWFWSGFDTIERIDKVGAFLSNQLTSLIIFQVYSVKAYHEKAGFAPAAGKSLASV